MGTRRTIAGGLLAFAAGAGGFFAPEVRSEPNRQSAATVEARNPELWGRFSANPKVTLLEDGRSLRLDENFVYTDGRSKAWLAPKDSVVDGASIPKIFWSLIGGPLDGPYRNASIVHDVGCDEKREQWKDIHRMFYEACRCGGLDERKAKKMYWAVYHFGPRWEIEDTLREVVKTDENGKERKVKVQMRTARPRPRPRAADEKDLAEAEALMQRGNPSLDELERTPPKRK